VTTNKFSDQHHERKPPELFHFRDTGDSNVSDVIHYSGYEGDASDADDDTAASATLAGNGSSVRFPVLQTALLDFWLILRQELDKMHVFFQTRCVDFYSYFLFLISTIQR